MLYKVLENHLGVSAATAVVRSASAKERLGLRVSADTAFIRSTSARERLGLVHERLMRVVAAAEGYQLD